LKTNIYKNLLFNLECVHFLCVVFLSLHLVFSWRIICNIAESDFFSFSLAFILMCCSFRPLYGLIYIFMCEKNLYSNQRSNSRVGDQMHFPLFFFSQSVFFLYPVLSALVVCREQTWTSINFFVVLCRLCNKKKYKTCKKKKKLSFNIYHCCLISRFFYILFCSASSYESNAYKY
jgi:hypothetical protein